MSKKKFTDGLESLFADYDHELIVDKKRVPGANSKGESPASKDKVAEADKRSSGKNFANDLEAFLQAAFEDSFDRQQGKNLSQLEETALKKRSHRPMSGLDSLIRTTVDPKQMHYEEQPTRRLTIVFDEKKLSKLKEIARLEKTVLRDIIDEIVAGFIVDYERKKKQL